MCPSTRQSSGQQDSKVKAYEMRQRNHQSVGVHIAGDQLKLETNKQIILLVRNSLQYTLQYVMSYKQIYIWEQKSDRKVGYYYSLMLLPVCLTPNPVQSSKMHPFK